MKRILSLVLILALSLCMFAACGEDTTNPTADGATLADAKDYLYAMYKDNAEVTAVNFTVVGTVMIGGVSYNVEWSVDNDAIKIAPSGKFFTIEIPKSIEEINYKLTATISDAAGNKETVTFNYKVPAAAGLPANIADGTYVILAGNLTMSSLEESKGYGYPTANAVTVEGGVVSGHFKADVLTITNVDGGVTIQDAYGRYFYLKGTYNSFNVDAAAPAEGHIWEVLQNGDNYIFVNKMNGKTLAYSTSYTSWGAYPELTDDYTTLLTVLPAVAPETDPEKPADPEVPEVPVAGRVTAPVAGTAYKFALVHGGKGNAVMYFTGIEKAGYPWYIMGAMTEAEAIDVFVEEVDGGLRLYFMVGEVKTYLDMHKDGTHYSLRLTTEPTAVYTWNTEHNTFVTMVDDKECFVGTSGTYDTFSCNTMDKIASSYVAHLYTEGGATETPETPENPGTSDTIADGNKVMIYYPDGSSYVTATLDGKKLAAGTEAEAAVWTVTVTAEGYYMFACNGLYMTSGATGNSMTLEETANEYSLWELIACDGGYYLRNVNAAYNGNANQYLEFYNGFTTYGFNESKANIYTFQFVIVE